MAIQRYNVNPNDQMTNRDQAKALEAHRLSQARHNRMPEGGYLQSLDRSMNKDSWGNSPSFLQGSIRSGADPLIQMGIDDKAKKEFLAQTELNRSDGTSWDDFKQDASDMYGKAKDYLSGATADKEGAESAYNWQDPNKKEEMYGNPAFQVAAQQRESELGQWGDIAKYDMPESPTQQIAGSGTGHHPESMMPAPQSLLAGQVGTGDQHGGQVLDSLADSPKATESTALSGKEKAMLKLGQSLLSGGQDSPDQRVPLAGVKMGKAAFPNLLASSQRPVNPRYTNKGLG